MPSSRASVTEENSIFKARRIRKYSRIDMCYFQYYYGLVESI